MYALAIEDGDLQISGGSYDVRTGAAKTEQDVTLALGEPLGNDRFHPGFGSQLYNFIGLPLTQAALFQVEQEVARVVNNYAAVQYDQIQTDALSGSPSRFTTSEIIGQVTQIQVDGSLDTILITISIQTVDEQDLILSTSIGGSGNA